LFQLLRETLLATGTPDCPCRVVFVSSIGHRCSPVRFHDYNFTKESYDPWKAYGQSKTANIYIANEIDRRYGSEGLHATSLHPGLVITKPRNQEGWQDPKVLGYLKSVEQGAATSVYAALSKEWERKGGRFLADCVEQGPTRHSENPMYVGDDGYESWVYDEKAASRLWQDSSKMVGLGSDE
jgi:NAD(P)-dependent dehydrogenase (short-subunit alcohol dehydrogenase family)